MNPNYATIITPIEPSQVDWCRNYLQANAEPQLGTGDAFLQCRPLFRFDRIAGLHFCSFVILDADDGFGPSLVFEATFDGPKAEFLEEVLRIAPVGFDTLYRRCEGYPASGVSTRNLVREYLDRHDVGANTFFSGNPGRSVAQIKGESSIRNGIVSFFSNQFATEAVLPGRPAGLIDLVTRACIRGTDSNRWAEQPAQTPWQVTFRSRVAIAAVIVAVILVGCLGALVLGVAGHPPTALFRDLSEWLEASDQAAGGGGQWGLPWVSALAGVVSSSARGALAVVAVAWLVIRAAELILSSASRNTRDQFLLMRFPLQLAVITRYVLVALIAGIVMLALVYAVEKAPIWSGVSVNGIDGLGTTLAALGVTLLQLICVAALLLVARHLATSLRVMVEVQPLRPRRENLRRLALDVMQFAIVMLGGIAVLLVATVIPHTDFGQWVAGLARWAIYGYFVALLLVWVGAMAAYAVGLLALLLIGVMEHRDRSRFAAPAALLARTGVNAEKYVREEGGINRFQNHLASITTVKPGIVRRTILRFVLFAINVLAKFWFNKGDLGGIPTILSARWVMIDGGRRLLFLDNFSGAWESYLNEFIDLSAVKGLNAIWTNTFVSAVGKRFGFPATHFLFWKGAQDARPFKAYVRQSQIQTIVWYGAYPTLGVFAINANTDTRQALFAPLNNPAIDRFLQRL